jgi:hypothetical protein
MSGNPAPAGHIGNGALIADKVSLGLGELGVHDAVETACLVLVAVHTVLDLLRGVA